MATDTPTTVDVPGMHTGANYIQHTSDSLDSTEQQLKGTEQNLMATWRGDSARAFSDAMIPFYNECRSIINTLAQLSEKVDNEANIYQATHENNTTLARNLTAKIPSSPSGLSGF